MSHGYIGTLGYIYIGSSFNFNKCWIGSIRFQCHAGIHNEFF